MKYLLEIHHGIGDIVQYTGLIKSVRAYAPDAYIALVVNKESYKTLLTHDANINKVYVIDFSGSKLKLFCTIFEIRKEHFDYMICSIHSRQKSMEFMALTFGAKMVVGSKLSRLSRISKKYINITVNQSDHVVKQNNDVLLGLNLGYQLFEPYLICSDVYYKLPKHSVGLCIGTSIPHKTWPLDRFIAVGEALERLGYSIVLLGGKKEEGRYIDAGYKKDSWINLLGKTDLIGSASECAQCEMIIGGDTGLMHMAAAVGTKTLTLFSCSEPTTHAPYSKQSYYYYVPTTCQFCFGTEALATCKDYKCLRAIDVAIITNIAKGILEESKEMVKYKLVI